MGAPYYYLVAEAGRRLINPTSEAKVLGLGRDTELGPGKRVLDMGCGKGEPACLLAREYGCEVVGVDFEPTFLEEAVARAKELGVEQLCTFIEKMGAEYEIEPEGFDVVMALGTSFVYENLAGTVNALQAGLKPEGFMVLGEPYWKVSPPPEEYLEREGLTAISFATLPETKEMLESWGFNLVRLVDANLDEWDSYESHHWLAVDSWFRQNPGHPKALEVLRRMEYERETYLRWGREALGWAYFVVRPSTDIFEATDAGLRVA